MAQDAYSATCHVLSLPHETGPEVYNYKQKPRMLIRSPGHIFDVKYVTVPLINDSMPVSRPP